MSKMMCLVAFTLLITGLLPTDAASVASCTGNIKANPASKIEACLASINYAKCLILDTKEYDALNAEEGMKKFKSQYAAGLAERGVKCDINVLALVEEMQARENRKLEGLQAEPKGYANSRTVGECTDTFESEAASCTGLNPYLNCVIRILNLQRFISGTTQEERQIIENIIEGEMSALDLKCNIDLAHLSLEAGRDETTTDTTPGSQKASRNTGPVTAVSSFRFLTVVVSTCVSMIVSLLI